MRSSKSWVGSINGYGTRMDRRGDTVVITQVYRPEQSIFGEQPKAIVVLNDSHIQMLSEGSVCAAN